MTKSKSRIGKKDIFASTTQKPGKAEVQKTIIPVGSSVNNKVTVILPPEQVSYLDRLALDIRINNGAKIRRTEIIRALIAALQSSKLDLTTAISESDLTDRIKSALIR